MKEGKRASFGISIAGVMARREDTTIKKSKTFHGCEKKGRHHNTSMLACRFLTASADAAACTSLTD